MQLQRAALRWRRYAREHGAQMGLVAVVGASFDGDADALLAALLAVAHLRES